MRRFRFAADCPVLQRDSRQIIPRFSHQEYIDRAWMGFAGLRVLTIQQWDKGAAVAMAQHANMQVLTLVLEGALDYQDSLGNVRHLPAGALMQSNNGFGLGLAFANAHAHQTVRFLQLWLQPAHVNAPPTVRAVDNAMAQQTWQIQANAHLQLIQLCAGQTHTMHVHAKADYWLMVLNGAVHLDAQKLLCEDSAVISAENATLQLRADDAPCQVLLLQMTDAPF